ncbi:hypothetical protein QYE76_001850 [Lolium multiflorum]|uniref:CCHC-type domain-containing protein n=1 Tax=Lolium multiflorum TaxID=4521 RepID=A0AAD8RMI9_LOLMU|nr:hypothetical protein QYE76_001850 [Lolium multiflorum]
MLGPSCGPTAGEMTAVRRPSDGAAASADYCAGRGNACPVAIMASPSISFNQFLEKEKLKSNGSNFTDWFRHVRIFLNGGNLQYVLEAPLGPPPPPAVSKDVKNVYETRVTRYSQVQCAIMCSLKAELQKRFEHHDPCDMINELKVIFETHAAVESYEVSKHFFGCMMEEGSSVSEHVFAMSGHAKKLSDLGITIPNQLGIHRVLQSLPPSYKNFVMNYNMQNMNKELPELFSMLKSAEIEIKKEHQMLMVNKTTSFKKQGKPKKENFKKGGKKAAAPPEKPKAGPKPDAECYYCKEKGHWKRNCPKYLADLKTGLVKKKKEILVRKYSRNWTKSTPSILFFPEASRAPERDQRGAWGAHTPGRRGQGPGRAPLWCGPTRAPPRLPFRLLKDSVAKPYTEKPRYEKSSRAAAIAKPRFGGQKSLFGTPPDGELPRKASPSTPPPSPSTLLLP